MTIPNMGLPSLVPSWSSLFKSLDFGERLILTMSELLEENNSMLSVLSSAIPSLSTSSLGLGGFSKHFHDFIFGKQNFDCLGASTSSSVYELML